MTLSAVFRHFIAVGGCAHMLLPSHHTKNQCVSFKHHFCFRNSGYSKPRGTKKVSAGIFILQNSGPAFGVGQFLGQQTFIVFRAFSERRLDQCVLSHAISSHFCTSFGRFTLHSRLVGQHLPHFVTAHGYFLPLTRYRLELAGLGSF